MKDVATYTAYAPRAAKVAIRFQAQGFLPDKPYELHITAPDGTERAYPVVGLTSSAMHAVLPAGKSTFRLVASGTPPRAVGSGDLRVVSLRVSEWSIS